MRLLCVTFFYLVLAVGLAHEDNKGYKTALLVVDVQDCFMEASGTASGQAGSLAVADTAAIIPLINNMRTEKNCLFDVVVRSQDFHPVNHISFGPTHGLQPFAHLSGKGGLPLVCINPSSGFTADASCCPKYHITPYDCDVTLCPDVAASDAASSLEEILSSPACSVCRDTPDECFETDQAMWTNHCLQEGDSNFPPSLITEETDIVVQKGGNQYVDSYSAFMDNTRKLKTQLDDILVENEVGTIYVVGIATDYCVYFSTIDAIGLGYHVKLVLDATRGIANETVNAALADMEDKGAKILNYSDVMAMECPTKEEESRGSGSAVALHVLLRAILGSFLAIFLI